MKLNIGCGNDYRDGFVNIDGNEVFSADVRMDVSKESLLSKFASGSVEYIVAYDIIEHVHHWEAVRLFGEFRVLLCPGGLVEIKVPDIGFLLSSQDTSTIEAKIQMLYGSQDIPIGADERMDKARKSHPEYHCHRYGWTAKSLRSELVKAGFVENTIKIVRIGGNLLAKAYG